jgi:hypothetical protein
MVIWELGTGCLHMAGCEGASEITVWKLGRRGLLAVWELRGWHWGTLGACQGGSILLKKCTAHVEGAADKTPGTLHIALLSSATLRHLVFFVGEGHTCFPNLSPEHDCHPLMAWLICLTSLITHHMRAAIGVGAWSYQRCGRLGAGSGVGASWQCWSLGAKACTLGVADRCGTSLEGALGTVGTGSLLGTAGREHWKLCMADKDNDVGAQLGFFLDSFQS